PLAPPPIVPEQIRDPEGLGDDSERDADEGERFEEEEGIGHEPSRERRAPGLQTPEPRKPFRRRMLGHSPILSNSGDELHGAELRTVAGDRPADVVLVANRSPSLARAKRPLHERAL